MTTAFKQVADAANYVRKTNVGLQTNRLGQGLIATSPIAKGSLIFDFSAAAVAPERTYLSVQVSETEHVNDPVFLAKLNHSCEPNVFVDCGLRQGIALHDIATDELITYFYPQTEWEIVQPFGCVCGAASCAGLIHGARDMPADLLARYKLSDHIRTLLKQRG